MVFDRGWRSEERRDGHLREVANNKRTKCNRIDRWDSLECDTIFQLYYIYSLICELILVKLAGPILILKFLWVNLSLSIANSAELKCVLNKVPTTELRIQMKSNWLRWAPAIWKPFAWSETVTDPRLFLSRLIFSHFPLLTRRNIDKTAVAFMLSFIT